MGAVLRPRLTGSRVRRALLAFFLLDETFGFAVAAGDAAEPKGGDRGRRPSARCSSPGSSVMWPGARARWWGCWGRASGGGRRGGRDLSRPLRRSRVAGRPRRGDAVRAVAAAILTVGHRARGARPARRRARDRQPRGRAPRAQAVTPLVLAAIAALTYLSRATSLVFLPPPRGHFAAVLARMPAPIFASLAALTLVGADGSPAAVPVLCASGRSPAGRAAALARGLAAGRARRLRGRSRRLQLKVTMWSCASPVVEVFDTRAPPVTDATSAAVRFTCACGRARRPSRRGRA